MKKSEIQKNAEKLMKDKGVDTVHATSDGQLFFEKNAAELHRDTNAKGDKLTVFVFGAAEGEEGKDETPEAPKGLNAKDTVAKIATIEDVAILDTLEAEEKAGQNRKTVLEAIGARNAALAKDGGEKNDDKRKEDDK